jgi:hypothetical protein
MMQSFHCLLLVVRCTLSACVLTLFALSTGCQQVDDWDGQKAPINFTFTEEAPSATRATPALTTKRIGVFGYSTATNWATNHAAATADYFLNKMVISNGATWSYDGITKYWSSTGKISFFAYCPYQDVAGMVNGGTPYTTIYPANATTDTDSPTLGYTVSPTVTNQIDLLYGVARDNDATTNNGAVNFTMEHALAQVDVALKLDAANDVARPMTVTVTKVELTKVKPTSTFNLAASSWATPSGDDTTYELTPTNGLVEAESLLFDARGTGANAPPFNDYRTLNADNGHWMLIPQTLSGSVLNIYYTLKNFATGTTTDLTYTSSALSTQWEAGKTYKYQVTLSLNGASKVGLTIGMFDAGTGSIQWTDQGTTGSANVDM